MTEISFWQVVLVIANCLSTKIMGMLVDSAHKSCILIFSTFFCYILSHMTCKEHTVSDGDVTFQSACLRFWFFFNCELLHCIKDLHEVFCCNVAHLRKQRGQLKFSISIRRKQENLDRKHSDI